MFRVRRAVRGVFFLLSSSAMWGQGVTATIRGTVSDPSGGAISGAAVTVDDVTKGWSRTAISGAAGEYEFVQLPPADTL